MPSDHTQEKQSTDPRFARVYNDPKFRKTKKNDLKIKLDNRFSKKDLEFKKKSKIDKYGRKIKDNKDEKALNDFDKYFEKEGSEETKQEGENAEEVVEDEEEEEEAQPIIDRARGEVPDDYVSSSDEFTSSDSESSGESELDSDIEDDVEADAETAKPEVGEPSKTLAVVNLDWDHVKSTDLMITFSSFLPKGGRIEKISIYPSQFGKDRMEREDVEGPAKELFQKNKKKYGKKKAKAVEEDDDSDVSDVDIKDLYEEGDTEKEVDRRALRQYQLGRLRYYYAVVYCNNIDSASAIYQNCDGTEYESTANMFDMRFVPEGMEFDDEARDECTELPKNYKPLQFSTDALQHSNVKLTWDETPVDRVAIAKRAFSQKEIEDMDFKAYLASDSDDSEEEADQSSKSKLLALVGKSFGSKAADKANEDEEEGVDMEITFTPGLEGKDANSEAEVGKEENTIEKVRRKEKERRKARKDKLKQMKKSTEQEKKEKFKTSRYNKEGTETEADRKSRAELELLMMEDEDDTEKAINKEAHFNMNEILRSEKEKGKRSKYQNKNKIVEDKFEANLNDPRFSEMFEDRDFAIDPSQPEFKETQTMKQILKERNKRSKYISTDKNSKRRKTSGDKQDGNDSTKIASIVSKLKNKNHKK